MGVVRGDPNYSSNGRNQYGQGQRCERWVGDPHVAVGTGLLLHGKVSLLNLNLGTCLTHTPGKPAWTTILLSALPRVTGKRPFHVCISTSLSLVGGLSHPLALTHLS